MAQFSGKLTKGIASAYTGTGFIYDKKLETIPKFYSHKFRLTYDSLVSYEFNLLTDSTGEFSPDYNNRFRDYVWLTGYVNLINSKAEFDQLVNIGVEFFGDARFTISFSDMRHVDTERIKSFTRQQLSDIRKNKIVYELIDRDWFHDERNQKYETRAILVDPNTKVIMSEITLARQYVY